MYFPPPLNTMLQTEICLSMILFAFKLSNSADSAFTGQVPYCVGEVLLNGPRMVYQYIHFFSHSNGHYCGNQHAMGKRNEGVMFIR